MEESKQLIAVKTLFELLQKFLPLQKSKNLSKTIHKIVNSTHAHWESNDVILYDYDTSIRTET